MRFLITDSFCSSNRGDAAILDGMISGLRERGGRVEVVSHFPDVARRFHDVDVIDDRDVRAVALAVARADLVVSCGGSFLHDLYAPNLNARLATLHLARRCGKPYAIFAQSVGPLTIPLSRTAVREVLDGATWIHVRDEASARVVANLGVRAPVHVGVDAAVLGRVNPVPAGIGPILGITVRNWHFPGARDPAALQANYEAQVAIAADRWVRHTGGQVRFFSTCTSYGGYRQDDRVAARRVASRMTADAEVCEIVDLDFATLRGECGACDVFIGTRMHSLVFATTAGVPAVGIAYENKTHEWMEQVGLGGRVMNIDQPEGIDALLMVAWEERQQLAEMMAPRIEGMREAGREGLDQLVRLAQGERPARQTAQRREESGWNGETWRFDLAHDRLRKVADIVLAEGGERVLDLGASTGKLGRMLGAAFDYTGVDMAASVTANEARFRVHTASLDDWRPNGQFDVVTASGSLEYVADLETVLAKARASLVPGGLAVFTLFNLAHVSRTLGSAPRHPTWALAARPDDFALALHEAGLAPQRFVASTAGYGPAPSIHDERPTDFDRDGPTQLPPERMVRLAHQWIFVCRAGAPTPGARALAAAFTAGDHITALRTGAELVRVFPWAARAWSDLAVAWSAVGRNDRAADAAKRAWALDPTREDTRANLAALRVGLPVDDLEVAALADPHDEARLHALVGELVARGRLHGAAAVSAYRRESAGAAAK